MRLATVRTPNGTRAVEVDGATLVDLGVPDVGAYLSGVAPSGLTASVEGTLDDPAPVVTAPSKIFCVGLNYRPHILEMGRELPEHPTLFAKFAETLIGARDDLELPPETTKPDWEAELAVVVGRAVRRADEQQAAEAIAGFTVLNDFTARDYQYRTLQWLQGKTFESTTPVGPVLVTPDELPGDVRPKLDISCTVNGAVVQSANTADLCFDPVFLVQYISRIVTLKPGDLIATGTPGGVGHARKPPVFLRPGDLMVTEIEGIGRLENRIR